MTAHGLSLRERLVSGRVVTESGCWEWTRARVASGSYGVLHVEGRNVYTHRAAYETFVGPIPADLTIDHLCRTATNRRTSA